MNKISFKFLLISFVILGVLGCEDDPVIPIPDICKRINYSDELFGNEPSQGDPFIFERVSVEEDELYVTVSYGGGCGEVDFELYGVLSPILIYPPQVNVRLVFDDRDFCEALITKDLCFDLIPISERSDSGIVNLNIMGYDSLLTYRWD